MEISWRLVGDLLEIRRKASAFMFMHRKLMFAVRELMFMRRELMFIAREQNFPRYEDIFSANLLLSSLR